MLPPVPCAQDTSDIGLSDFTIEKTLGRGGFGMVTAAVTADGADVAIKMMRRPDVKATDDEKKESASMALAESQCGLLLTHDNVVSNYLDVVRRRLFGIAAWA